MFLQYAPPGAVLPLFSLRLKELGFTHVQIGWACAPQAVATVLAPLLAGQAADRWWPAERCLAACAFAATGLLWLLAEVTTPLAVTLTYLATWLCVAPTMTLGTAVSFAQLADPERDFGRVRLWGTVGWVVSGWLLGYWLSTPAWAAALLRGLRPAAPYGHLADAFRFAALFAAALGVYALTLPQTPPHRAAVVRVAPLAALRLLRRRPFAVFAGCLLTWCVTLAFVTQVTPLLLDHLGVPWPWLVPALTLSQTMEVTALALLPMFLLRLGLRGTMLLGLSAWLVGLVVSAVGRPLGLVVGSLVTQGLCICCFVVAGQVFVNGQAHGDVRASAQGLITVLNGLGQLGGNLLVGWVRREADGAFPPTFGVAAALAALALLALFVGFRGVGAVGPPSVSEGTAEFLGTTPGKSGSQSGRP
jgi:MFS family permease